jgi:hypothetical protein
MFDAETHTVTQTQLFVVNRCEGARLCVGWSTARWLQHRIGAVWQPRAWLHPRRRPTAPETLFESSSHEQGEFSFMPSHTTHAHTHTHTHTQTHTIPLQHPLPLLWATHIHTPHTSSRLLLLSRFLKTACVLSVCCRGARFSVGQPSMCATPSHSHHKMQRVSVDAKIGNWRRDCGWQCVTTPSALTRRTPLAYAHTVTLK